LWSSGDASTPSAQAAPRTREPVERAPARVGRLFRRIE